jgi:hypothetical protein
MKHFKRLKAQADGEVKQAFIEIPEKIFRCKAQKMEALAQESIKNSINPYEYLFDICPKNTYTRKNPAALILETECNFRMDTEERLFEDTRFKSFMPVVPLQRLSHLREDPVEALIFLFYHTERKHKKHSLNKLTDPVGSKKHFVFLKEHVPIEINQIFSEMRGSTFRGKAIRMDKLSRECFEKRLCINPYFHRQLEEDLIDNEPSIAALEGELTKQIKISEHRNMQAWWKARGDNSLPDKIQVNLENLVIVREEENEEKKRILRLLLYLVPNIFVAPLLSIIKHR